MTRNSLLLLTALALLSCQDKSKKMTTDKKSLSLVSDKYEPKNKATDPTCKLTTPELQQRKSTVIESLRKQVIQTKDLANGYAFKFTGTDKMVDELTEFIKTERECCDFFTFTLSVKGDKSEIWLEMTGAEGTKDFMKAELEL
jgi:hypothetical protein